jgi:ATP-dependent RNA helicase DeaD
VSFASVHPALARALSERGYLEPTPVQAAVAAPELADRDILVSAQTGSGKTVAFGLSMAADLLGENEKFGRAGAPQALVIAPTRELAMQVERELAWLYEPANARIATCVGGMDARRERRRLEDGVHIVVGTPGRLRDHLERGGLDLSALDVVVLDEADEMLDMGFREDLEFILDAMPKTRRTLMFSATLPKGIVALAQNYQNNAQRIAVKGAAGGHADIEHRAYRARANEIEFAVVNLLRYFDARTAIVFMNTREAARHCHATLTERGFSSVLLSGELSQHERNQSMQALRDGRARVCVATDVAARGIDLPDLGLVIHADLPHDAEAFQHRSGRTGRAGRKGISAIVCSTSRRYKADRLLRDANISLQWQAPPTAEDIRELDEARLLNDPLITEPMADEDRAMARTLMNEKTAEELAAALVRVYRARLPAIEDISDPGEINERRRRDDPRDRSNPRDKNPRTRDERPERGARQERPERSPRREFEDRDAPRPKRPRMEGGVWFKLDLGRTKNADPKWLVPLICRRGDISKADLGSIKIFDRETFFEVSADAAESFALAAKRPDPENIRISPSTGPSDAQFEPRRKDNRDDERGESKRPFKERDGGKNFAGKKFAGKKFEGKKFEGKRDKSEAHPAARRIKKNDKKRDQ